MKARKDEEKSITNRVLRFSRFWSSEGRQARSGAGSKANGSRQSRARWGEALAAWFLRFKGYRVEARNWRCPQGELDIVCWDGETLVFVEVKTRSSAAAGDPEDAVDRRKQQRLVRLALVYLAGLGREAPPCRFDVIAIESSRLGPRVRHLRSAFRADGLV